MESPKRSQLRALIDMACDPNLVEPDLSINLEICDLINQKQTSYPREAAMAILEHVNGRETHSSMLALALLDVLAKNCGFPFHLQLATKDFLNELVRRFPERPPAAKSATQEKILALVQNWNFNIFETSRFRPDLVHINDMYRLLSSKGYTFPRMREEEANVMRKTSTFKTKDELESEDKAVQAAKLQELLRRGTPADLKAANDLMKVMSGFNIQEVPNYEKKEEEELEKLEGKTNRLIELLNGRQPGENVSRHPEIQELVAILKTSQPKITKWVEENGGEDDYHMQKTVKYLELNDYINEVMGRYEDIKQNKQTGKIETRSLGTGGTQTSPPASNESAVLIDLLGGDVPAPTTAPTTTAASAKAVVVGPQDLLADLSGLSFTSNAPSGNGLKQSPSFGPGTGAIRLDALNPAFFTQPAPTEVTKVVSSQSGSVLGSPSPVKNSATTILADFASPPTVVTAVTESPNAISIPESVMERPLLDKSGVKITIRHHAVQDKVLCECYFSNGNSAPVSGLNFQIAVPTSMKLHLEPLTGTVLPPRSTNSVMLSFKIQNPAMAGTKFRFKLSYLFSSLSVTEQGEYAAFH